MSGSPPRSDAVATMHTPYSASMGALVDGGPRDTWLSLLAGENIPLNLADEFAAIATLYPDAPISIVARHGKRGHHEYEALTYRRCQELMDCYARGMRNLGIERGDTAVVLLKPMRDFMPVLLALLKVGAIPVALEPGEPREQKLKSIQEIGPKVMVAIPSARALRILYPRAFRSITRTVAVGDSWLAGRPMLKSFRQHSPCPSAPTMKDDPMFIGYTTGSTGPAKGVVYTQGNGAAIIQGMKDALGLRPGEVCLACHPAFALYFAGAGGAVVTPDLDPRFPAAADPACLLAIIRDHKPTVAFMQLPVMRKLWQYCASHGEKLPHLTKILTTGASVTLDLVEGVHQIAAQPAADLYVMYGATEALCISFATGREILAMAPRMRDGQGTYLGRPSPWTQVCIIGITDQPIAHWSPDLVLPTGQIGEICVCGPVVTPQYSGLPTTTHRAKIQDNGRIWHRMGDAGYLDDDGGLWYCGRIADRVATGTGHLYADLVEPIFNAHPAVARSALVGVPGAESSQQRPVILVETRPEAGELDVASAHKLMAELKVLAAEHSSSRVIEDVRLYKGAFPVDVRHGAKIRRDLLSRYAGEHTDPLPAQHSILFKGHRLAYYEQGHGEPILFLHNAGNDHHVWQHQLEYFSATCRVVAVDSLGYGQSDNPALDYSLSLYTEMVAALIDMLALAPVTIVGTCTGAAMALNYALQQPHKVKRLILFHVATERTVRGGGFERITGLVSGRPALARAISPVVDALMSRGLLHRGMIRSQYGANVDADPGFIDHLHRLYGKPGQATCLLNLFSNWPSFAPLDELTYPDGQPPLHVLWGEQNKLLPVQRGRELCQRLRPATFEVIAGGGHLVMREQPEIVTRRIAELAHLAGA